MTRALIAALAALLAAVAAQAEPRLWAVDPAASSLGVRYVINGKVTPGHFAKFSGEATFDEAALEAAEMALNVETGSVDVGDPFGTTFVKSVDWFDVENHPKATYVLQALRHIEGDRYRAEGLLTIRGKTNPVAGDMVVAINGDTARAVGETSFNRKEFRIGIGFSTLFVEIGPDVTVLFDLTARPVE